MRAGGPFLEQQLPQPGRLERTKVALTGLAAAAMGAAPHVLHHAGPLAGAALVSGALGTMVFGVLGFALTVPMLLRIRRSTGGWRVPAIVLGGFVGLFALSSLVIGPALQGDETTTTPGGAEHEDHHR